MNLAGAWAKIDRVLFAMWVSDQELLVIRPLVAALGPLDWLIAGRPLDPLVLRAWASRYVYRLYDAEFARIPSKSDAAPQPSEGL